ncbi:enoyl-CoA hydratase-related protein [Gordonia rubripertincta]|uniref:Enoyl-CoA hydratase-related protein n=1 Tax=Gordonia rubripertincta TaxID=36822 RepID=A0ABT4MNF8_GORRU|nr:enoyl-CoA hydratase-related protein [Gordonia rubripertincta]MCZ4548534.1 enoyl-CoA hydratase-related protein [Gordonia rubripertincta]
MTETSTESVVELERRGAVGVVWLNRPDRLNAFTLEMRTRIIEAIDECDADDSIRVVVLTGRGRAFCAGADLEAGGDTFVLDDDPETGGAPADSGGEVALRLYRSTKPVVAAINGPAAGVGVTMSLPADIRIASETAKFGFVFTRRGLVPEACSTWFLPRVVGISTALEWAVGGKMVSASEALERGLVREVVPVDQVLDRAIAVATDLVSGTSPVSVALTRQMMWRMLGAESPEVAHRAESEAIYVRGTSDDVREGVAAFLEKRVPVFPLQVSAGLPQVFD